MKVGIVAHPHKEASPKALGKVSRVLSERGFEVVLEAETAGLVGQVGVEDICAGVDMVISLGGDGTLLETVHRMTDRSVPVAGVNIGTLGFLTTCTDEEIDQLAEVLERGEQSVVDRVVLSVRVRDESGEVRDYLALNEVALMRGETGRLVALDARVDGELLNHYRADGLIVATPTGSTAYSLAAGGPLISPQAGVFVLTPICPHSMSNRSLVVADDATIEIFPGGGSDERVLFAVDGRAVLPLGEGGVVTVTKAAQPLQLVRMPDHSFYETLRRKLHWH